LEHKRAYNDAVRAALAHKTKLIETRARTEELTTNKTTHHMRSPAEWQARVKQRERKPAPREGTKQASMEEVRGLSGL
jgi:hypothetical protein